MDTYKKYDQLQENVWTEECEQLLAEWSERASCYRWLHGRCEKKYQRSYYSFSIPVIILSTLTGAANVGMDSFVAEENKSIASAIVGGVNILAGIVSTLQNFLKVAELMEAHRIAGVSWGKLQRNISIELALDPSRRVLQSDFLKLSRAEYDRLIEAGPLIDDSIIYQFNKKFKNYGVSVPSICNGLDKCNIYKRDIDDILNNKTAIKKEDYNDGIEDIISSQEKDLIKKEEEIKKEKSNIKVEIKDDVELDIEQKFNEMKENNKDDKIENMNDKETNTEDEEILLPDNQDKDLNNDEKIIPDEDSDKDDEERLLNESNDFLNGIK